MENNHGQDRDSRDRDSEPGKIPLGAFARPGRGGGGGGGGSLSLRGGGGGVYQSCPGRRSPGLSPGRLWGGESEAVMPKEPEGEKSEEQKKSIKIASVITSCVVYSDM